ncbi:hypothetical protein M426DRAFT_202104 [Hypoxylon sp. CI-4A]|nr:hypothetical protein M426DRAFT_202104 [Hypoxylon sp. CI-4A]
MFGIALDWPACLGNRRTKYSMVFSSIVSHILFFLPFTVCWHGGGILPPRYVIPDMHDLLPSLCSF